MPAGALAWLAPAWILLGVMRLAILVLPTRRLAPLYGTPRSEGPWVPLTDAAEARRAAAVSRAVRTAARHTPWESSCYPQALAARLLLRLHRVPHAVFFGVSRGGTDAHAWVAAGLVAVTGGRAFRGRDVAAVFCDTEPLEAPRR